MNGYQFGYIIVYLSIFSSAKSACRREQDNVLQKASSESDWLIILGIWAQYPVRCSLEGSPRERV